MQEIPSSAYISNLARDAGSLALHYYGRHREALEIKPDYSIVTEADRAVERLIVERIRRDWPDHGILGEEGADERIDAERPVWIIDPIDGTSNFSANSADSDGVPIPTRTTRAPALAKLFLLRRNCATCSRQNGQPKWRKKTSTSV